ncbi:hypothetical protein DAI22_03g116950 [Oryza sativa Japonica Group]|nr:hypothetical protein DAI22_03g116950 [Oryza sativa Japonica Group]
MPYGRRRGGSLVILVSSDFGVFLSEDERPSASTTLSWRKSAQGSGGYGIVLVSIRMVGKGQSYLSMWQAR